MRVILDLVFEIGIVDLADEIDQPVGDLCPGYARPEAIVAVRRLFDLRVGEEVLDIAGKAAAHQQHAGVAFVSDDTDEAFDRKEPHWSAPHPHLAGTFRTDTAIHTRRHRELAPATAAAALVAHFHARRHAVGHQVVDEVLEPEHRLAVLGDLALRRGTERTIGPEDTHIVVVVII